MSRLRNERKRAGLSQAEVAQRAGVSRQAVSAIEAGRHLPRVDAALSIAAALGVEVGTLFAPSEAPVEVLSGRPAAEGSVVRVGRVGSGIVTVPVRTSTGGFEAADGIVEGGVVREYGRRRPGLVVAGCEPGLAAIEQVLREGAMASVAASASTPLALEALVGRRAHAAVVHGTDPDTYLPQVRLPIDRYTLGRWRVGLAMMSDAAEAWWHGVVAGEVPVVQREPGAGVQRTFERAAGRSDIAGPRVGSHLEAAYQAKVGGLAAVTIEPAARAFGLAFHPFEEHLVELWVATEWATEPSVTEAIDLLTDSRFQTRLGAVGGYDLTGCGGRVV